jgi:hypothetical protein
MTQPTPDAIVGTTRQLLIRQVKLDGVLVVADDDVDTFTFTVVGPDGATVDTGNVTVFDLEDGQGTWTADFAGLDSPGTATIKAEATKNTAVGRWLTFVRYEPFG